MTPIANIYIPRIESVYNAEFIANVFDKNDIAQVSKVYIEPYKTHSGKNEVNKYNRVYIAIKSWHETESAYNFINRLRNPTHEARIIYSDDNWWPVYIYHKNYKLHSNKRILNIFQQKQLDNLDLAISVEHEKEVEEGEVEEGEVIYDLQKTAILRNIIHNMNSKPKLLDQSIQELDKYMCEIDSLRQSHLIL